MAAPALVTPRLLLRPWREADLPAFAALNADPRVMQHFPAPLTREQSDRQAARIRAGLAERAFGLWAVEVRDGAGFIGFTGLWVPGFTARFTPCTEIAWRLAVAHWSRGYATEAATAALRHGFGTAGLEEIVAFTVPANRRSIAVMQRLGMTRSADDDFLHPGLPDGHVLRPHLLYRLRRADWRC